MILRKVTVEIYPYDQPHPSSYRLEIRVSGNGEEYSYTQIVAEDHLRSLFDYIFDGCKHELQRVLKR
jgi:DNA-directed RNA polymerase subunit L